MRLRVQGRARAPNPHNPAGVWPIPTQKRIPLEYGSIMGARGVDLVLGAKRGLEKGTTPVPPCKWTGSFHQRKIVRTPSCQLPILDAD